MKPQKNISKIVSLNPSDNYKIIGEIDSSTHQEIDSKINAARNAQPVWAYLNISERIAFLEKLYQAFISKKNDLRSIISQEMGMPISVCDLIDIDPALVFMRGYLDYACQWLGSEITYENSSEVHYLYFEPKGIVAASIPWNYPFTIFIWAVIQNLIVGNTIVIKHSEECPFTAKLLEEIVDSINLPHGVFNQVYGVGDDVGEYLMNSKVDLIWFTGSTAVGNHLYEVAAKKLIPATLELGGSAPGIVFEDADLKMTVESIYFNRYLNSGQTCDGLKRLIVHQNIFDKIVHELKKLILTKKIGPALDPSTDIGPLVNERQLKTLEDQVEDALEKGAHIIIGAKRPSNLKGAYYEPTILSNITCDMKVWTEEVFGPVLPIVPFSTEEEAIALANDTTYGLGAYIYTKDQERAFRVSKHLQAGNISINSANFESPCDPFGGYKKSGIGREHGKQGLRELCSTKVIALKK